MSWQDEDNPLSPDSGAPTALDAANLEAIETRAATAAASMVAGETTRAELAESALSAAIAAEVTRAEAAESAITGGGPGGGDTHTISALGSVGGTSAVAMFATVEIWVTLTLTADHVCTITPTPGGKIRFFVLQDAAGGHVFSVSDGTNTEAVPVSTSPSSPSMATVFCPSGTDLYIGP